MNTQKSLTPGATGPGHNPKRLANDYTTPERSSYQVVIERACYSLVTVKAGSPAEAAFRALYMGTYPTQYSLAKPTW